MKLLKKTLCLILALFMLAAVGCENPSTDESVPAESIGDISASNTDKTEYTLKIDEMMCGTSDRSLVSKNLLKGLAYTSTLAASSDYPDDGSILTDGISPAAFSDDNEWVGYLPRTGADLPIVIDFDLGSVQGGLLDFTLVSLENAGYGISAPTVVKVYVAGEDKEFIAIGTSYRPDGNLPQNQPWKFEIKLGNAIEARYIRYEITAKTSWCFVGEILALSYSENYVEEAKPVYKLNEYYSYTGIPEISSPEYWAETETDYNEEVNFVYRKQALISAPEEIDPDLATDWYNTKSTVILTNGAVAQKAGISDSAWFHITKGGSREITYDLTKTSAVSGFSIGFLRDSAPNVQLPMNFAVRLSEDGINWQTVYENDSLESILDSEIVRVEESLDKEYKARYVQFYFDVVTHIYVDEITVIGKKNVSDAADIIPDPEEDTDNGTTAEKGYMMPEDFYDVHNVMLSYHCYTDENNISAEDGLITAEEYLPYVAYLDEEGNIKDTFFDGFLYLPYTRLLYGDTISDFGRSADGWRTYIDDMFYPDRNMDALDACAEKVYNELGITDQKLKVFTSILYTFPNLLDGSINSFGDIDGDGINENFTNIEDRKKAIKWIMDEELKRFNEGNYENLEFCGYYWFEESIDYQSPHETALISFACDYAHQLGYKVFWIPYQTAAGIEDWENLGFDLACLQPNYVFNAGNDPQVLYITAERTKRLGMCVEIEINNPLDSYEATRYTEYLVAGAETGFMNAVKMYYQVGIPGAISTMCYSETDWVRKLYDDTYLYAKEKFVPIYPEDVVISEAPLEFIYNEGKSFRGNIDISVTQGLNGNLEILRSPKYGSVKLNSNGSFVYYPPADYSGEDSFEIAFDLGYGEPVSTTIILKCE